MDRGNGESVDTHCHRIGIVIRTIRDNSHKLNLSLLLNLLHRVIGLRTITSDQTVQ